MEEAMHPAFGADVLVQTDDPQAAAEFYTLALGLQITEVRPDLVSLRGPHLNLFLERGPRLGPVLEVFVENIAAAKTDLVKHGCTILKDEPSFPRCYVQDPFGLIYNLAQR
jgi:predicted enzyme related to lactoylglutathione lyase